METIFITNEPWRAHVAEGAGVDRIMVDLETLGKVERQGHLDTLISRHSLRDAWKVKSRLSTSVLMIRVNPIHRDSEKEIHASIDAGAEIIMLPMFNYRWEAEEFIAIIGRRAKTCLLFETGAALSNIRDVMKIDGIDEVHIGLNDLHLSLGLKFMFEIVAGGLVDYMASIFRERGVRFGIGGVARLGHGVLPAELVMGEHVRLGSSQVILSRDYANIFNEYQGDECIAVFREEMCRFKSCVETLRRLSPEELGANSEKVKVAVSKIVEARLASTRIPIRAGVNA
jgi:hypothetical protein